MVRPCRCNHVIVLSLFVALALVTRSADSFTPTFMAPNSRKRFANNRHFGSLEVNKLPAARPLILCMSREGEGSGILASIAGLFIVVLFVSTSFFPSFLGGKETPMGLAASVVTRQDTPGKFANFESDKVLPIERFYLREAQSNPSILPDQRLWINENRFIHDV